MASIAESGPVWAWNRNNPVGTCNKPDCVGKN